MTAQIDKLRDSAIGTGSVPTVGDSVRGDTDTEPSAAEREATGELVQGELAGKPIWVKPVKKWRASALAALRDGDFEEWARVTLEPDDWEIWLEVDPTLEQVDDFFASINMGVGTNPGNLPRSRRSATRTHKR